MAKLWDERQARSQDGTKVIKADITALERKAGQIMDRLLATDSPTLISVYENEIKRIENDKIALTEKLQAEDKPRTGLRHFIETAANSSRTPGNYRFLSDLKTIESCSNWRPTSL